MDEFLSHNCRMRRFLAGFAPKHATWKKPEHSPGASLLLSIFRVSTFRGFGSLFGR